MENTFFLLGLWSNGYDAAFAGQRFRVQNSFFAYAKNLGKNVVLLRKIKKLMKVPTGPLTW